MAAEDVQDVKVAGVQGDHQPRRVHNVYVKNLGPSVNEETLRLVFSQAGTVSSTVVMRDSTGISRGFGFVHFEQEHEAEKAVRLLNGHHHADGHYWAVSRAQAKSDAGNGAGAFDKDGLWRSNLYVKHLGSNVDESQLQNMFADFGRILSTKVLRTEDGTSRGVGFVQFASAADAERAIAEMDGKQVGEQVLHVALAQRKADRARVRPVHMRPGMGYAQAPMPYGAAMAPGLPFYPPGMHNPYFYGHPAMAPMMQPAPQLLAMHQMMRGNPPHQMLPPHLYMPWLPQHQAPFPQQQQVMQAYGRGRGRGGRGMQGPVARTPNGYQRANSGPNGAPAANGRTGSLGNSSPASSVSPAHSTISPTSVLTPQRGPQPARAGAAGKAAVQPEAGKVYEAGNRIPAANLATRMACAAPEQRRILLGEALYPLVEAQEPGAAAKVTGMLLEMDDKEVLHLLAAPAALREKVEEALDVLHAAGQHHYSGPAPGTCAAEVADVQQAQQAMATMSLQ